IEKYFHISKKAGMNINVSIQKSIKTEINYLLNQQINLCPTKHCEGGHLQFSKYHITTLFFER
ncbi:MAG: hypothetical protein JXB17_11340, partial [Bacteroidales bacterium]|nr:hypothetical protein [Bacteroidales bacterium]